jgi:hypothetical protein
MGLFVVPTISFRLYAAVPSSVNHTRTREVFLNYAHLREAGDSRPAGRHCGHAWISTR